MGEIICACALFLISAVLLFLAVRSFKNKGFLLNNSYIYASNKEREDMDKSKYYRQSGICLLLLAIALAVDGVAVLLKIDVLFALFYLLIAATIVYAIISSVRLSK